MYDDDCLFDEIFWVRRSNRAQRDRRGFSRIQHQAQADASGCGAAQNGSQHSTAINIRHSLLLTNANQTRVSALMLAKSIVELQRIVSSFHYLQDKRR
jgi:hypothetical protein